MTELEKIAALEKRVVALEKELDEYRAMLKEMARKRQNNIEVFPEGSPFS